jgi:hypothetical protein
MAFDFTPAELETEFRNTDGVEVALGSDTTWGHLDAEGLSVLDEPSSIGTELVLTLTAGRLSQLEQDCYLQVRLPSGHLDDAGEPLMEWVRFRAREVSPEQGGLEVEVLLARAD